jgi:hypothetical protein
MKLVWTSFSPLATFSLFGPALLPRCVTRQTVTATVDRFDLLAYDHGLTRVGRWT